MAGADALNVSEVEAPPVVEAASGRMSPWAWVPSLYFAQALPNVFVMTVSTYAFTRMGVSAVVIGYTTWLGLPWMLKPFWSPLVELVGNERRWIWVMELVASAAFFGAALGFTSDSFLLWTSVAYLLLAIASATHDIAADGYYMRVLTSHDQTWFAGIRSVAFRGGWIFAEGILVWIAGKMIRIDHPASFAWAVSHAAAGGTFLLLAIYHAVILPRLARLRAYRRPRVGELVSGVISVFAKYFAVIPLATALPFLLLYRFAEAQVVKFIGKFLLDSREVGGLGLLEEQVGFINGTLGVGALLAGGVLGGFLAAKDGLRHWLLPMAVAMNMTNLAFLALAYYQPTNLYSVAAAVMIEKFGYGLGFTGYMLYMLYLARGEHQTSFYAICTGFMTLGLILPGSLAGYPLQWLGYTGFFVWIIVATIPSFFVTWLVCRQMDPNFGRKEAAT